MTAVFDRTCAKYGDRGYRYVYLDAGHLCQNMWLTAVADGLGMVTVGGYYDRLTNRLLQIDGYTEATIYIALFGYPERTARDLLLLEGDQYVGPS